MRHTRLPTKEIPEQSLKPIGILLDNSSFAFVSWIIVEANNRLPILSFTNSIKRPLAPICINEIGKPLELFPLFFIVLALEFRSVGTEAWSLQLNISANQSTNVNRNIGADLMF